MRNSVRITGGVWRPGAYGAEPGLRLWDVIGLAGGLLPDAYEGRVQIQRLQDDYTRTHDPRQPGSGRGPDFRWTTP